MIDVLCKCGNVGQVTDDLAGQRIRCNHCSRPLRVPSTPLELPTSEEQAESTFQPAPEQVSSPHSEGKSVHVELTGGTSRSFREADRKGSRLQEFRRPGVAKVEAGQKGGALRGFVTVVIILIFITIDVLLDWL